MWCPLAAVRSRLAYINSITSCWSQNTPATRPYTKLANIILLIFNFDKTCVFLNFCDSRLHWMIVVLVYYWNVSSILWMFLAKTLNLRAIKIWQGSNFRSLGLCYYPTLKTNSLWHARTLAEKSHNDAVVAINSRLFVVSLTYWKLNCERVKRCTCHACQFLLLSPSSLFAWQHYVDLLTCFQTRTLQLVGVN